MPRKVALTRGASPAARPTISPHYIYDEFTGANGTALANHEPNANQNFGIWTPAGPAALPTCEISGNRARIVDAGDGQARW